MLQSLQKKINSLQNRAVINFLALKFHVLHISHFKNQLTKLDITRYYPFKLVESCRDGLGITISGVNNEKFVIDFRSSHVRQALSCIR